MKTRKAFTLIELLIVIAIIGILSSVIYINLNSAKKKSEDAKIKSDVASLATALEVVRADRNLNDIGWTTIVKDDTTNTENNINRWRDDGSTTIGLSATGKPLIANLPVNPVQGGNFGIRVISNGYAIIANLNGSQVYWCNNNGNGRKITGKAAPQANTDCATGL